VCTCVKDVIQGAKEITGAFGEERLLRGGVHAAPVLLHRWTHALHPCKLGVGTDLHLFQHFQGINHLQQGIKK